MDPLLRIKFLRLEHRNEILVPKLGEWSICCQMMFIFLGSLPVHVPGIPFIAERGNGIDTPVNEDSEFRIFIPFGYLILIKRPPVRLIRTIVCFPVYFLKNFFSP